MTELAKMEPSVSARVPRRCLDKLLSDPGTKLARGKVFVGLSFDVPMMWVVGREPWGGRSGSRTSEHDLPFSRTRVEIIACVHSAVLFLNV